MPARLAIDYGSGVHQGGAGVARRPLDVARLQRRFTLTNAVYAGSGTIAVGAEAWRFAETDPGGSVMAPLRADTDHVTVGGVDVEVSDLDTATLRQVAAEAARGGRRASAGRVDGEWCS
jgi:hypothetical protein